MVAEKPSVARAIAESLAAKQDIQIIKDKLETCPLYRWNMTFMNQSV
jgi:hypothetical protein